MAAMNGLLLRAGAWPAGPAYRSGSPSGPKARLCSGQDPLRLAHARRGLLLELRSGDSDTTNLCGPWTGMRGPARAAVTRRWHAGSVPEPEPSGPYLEAMQRAFQFAREFGRGCGPVEFLVGIAGGSGPAAAALQPDGGRSVRAAAAAADGASDGVGYLHMQAQEAAMSLAAGLGQPPEPEHLLIALLDQATPGVAQTLSRAGLEPATVRRAALAGLGAPADLPSLVMPALAPAGSMDRPPLAVGSLDARAWAVLRWRQDHLPLDRLRRDRDREALCHLERDAAWRLASQLGLDDDQRYSVVRQHSD